MLHLFDHISVQKRVRVIHRYFDHAEEKLPQPNAPITICQSMGLCSFDSSRLTDCIPGAVLYRQSGEAIRAQAFQHLAALGGGARQNTR